MTFNSIPLSLNSSEFTAPTEIKILNKSLQEIAGRSEKIFDAISESDRLIDCVEHIGLKVYDYIDSLEPGCLNGFDFEGIKVSREYITFVISDINGAEAWFSIELSKINELEFVEETPVPTNDSMFENCDEDGEKSDPEKWLKTLLACHKTLGLEPINKEEINIAKKVIVSLEPLLKCCHDYELLNFIENGEDLLLQKIPIIGEKLTCPISAILAFWLISQSKSHTQTADYWPFVTTELAPIYCIFGVSPPGIVLSQMRVNF